MIADYGVVDGEERLLARENDGKGGKMTLQPWVHRETSSGRVHSSDVLCVVDFLGSELGPAVPGDDGDYDGNPGENNDDDDEEHLGEHGVAVPVAIVQVLSDDRVRPSRPIRVNLGISSNSQI